MRLQMPFQAAKLWSTSEDGRSHSPTEAIRITSHMLPLALQKGFEGHEADMANQYWRYRVPSTEFQVRWVWGWVGLNVLPE